MLLEHNMTNEECLGRLVISATHDLRNALAVMRESTGLVQDLLHKDQAQRKERLLHALEQTQEQIKRSALLAEGMACLAMDAAGGEGDAHSQRCDLSMVVQHFCAMVVRRGRACCVEMRAAPMEESVLAQARAMDIFRDLLEVFDVCASVGGGIALQLSPVQWQGGTAIACEVLPGGNNRDMALSALTYCPLLHPLRQGPLARLLSWSGGEKKCFVLPIGG